MFSSTITLSSSLIRAEPAYRSLFRSTSNLTSARSGSPSSNADAVLGEDFADHFFHVRHMFALSTKVTALGFGPRFTLTAVSPPNLFRASNQARLEF
jgi:hypothetical protein